ncbi:MAG TPA: phosphate ABC transporter substrate-binding protein PstS [Nakamurella sp.]
MKITRMSGLLTLVAVGALTLSGCGSDNTTASTSSAAATSAATSGASAAVSSAKSGASAAVSSAAATATAGGGAAPTFDGSGFACTAGSLRSSGSTAQGIVMEQWISDFNSKCSATLLPYGGGGSGKGVADFLANQVDFAGSDSALSADQLATAKSTRCGGNDALNLPMVTGPLAVAYNVPGVTDLTLTPSVTAQIFNGKITTWNDPAIAALNPGVSLPALAIQSVHRSDDSGTTDNFVKWLKAAAPADWTFDTGKTWLAPGGVAGQGNDGVGKEVQATTGAVGYVEWGFALDQNLSIAKIDNGAGAVELTGEAASKTVEAAQVVGTGQDLTIKIDYATKAPGAYPIVLVTYELVCSAGNKDLGALLQSFLGYTATDGQATLSSLGAAPLPAALQTKVIASVKTISS